MTKWWQNNNNDEKVMSEVITNYNKIMTNDEDVDNDNRLMSMRTNDDTMMT